MFNFGSRKVTWQNPLELSWSDVKFSPGIGHGDRTHVEVDFSSSTAAFYAISVRAASALLAASFRFHLTMDTLAVQLTVPPVGPVEDLHLRASAPAGRTAQKSGSAGADPDPAPSYGAMKQLSLDVSLPCASRTSTWYLTSSPDGIAPIASANCVTSGPTSAE